MKIDQDVMVVLSRLEISGNLARIADQLDRKMYERVNRALEALGGKWTRKAKAHTFADSAQDRIDVALTTGEVATAREIGWFPTPGVLAADLVARAGVKRGDVVLEPSAGAGAIVGPLLAAGATVGAWEIDADRARMCSTAFPMVHMNVGDFMDCVVGGPMFDAVVMNPPFTRVGKGDHLDHVRHAFGGLKHGGTLVTVLPNSVTFREDRRHREFREWARAHSPHGLPLIFDMLPDGSFSSSGTNVRTVVLTLRA